MEIRDFSDDKVRQLVADYLGVDASQITDEAHLSDDLGVDWLDQLELLMLMEHEFVGVEFSDVTAIEVVGDLIRHMEMARHGLVGTSPVGGLTSRCHGSCVKDWAEPL